MFFDAIELSDLLAPKRAGECVQLMGTRAGGLTASAVCDFGLREASPITSPWRTATFSRRWSRSRASWASGYGFCAGKADA
jgi:hypothetical protein